MSGSTVGYTWAQYSAESEGESDTAIWSFLSASKNNQHAFYFWSTSWLNGFAHFMGKEYIDKKAFLVAELFEDKLALCCCVNLE